jgi:hypothetical protein
MSGRPWQLASLPLGPSGRWGAQVGGGRGCQWPGGSTGWARRPLHSRRTCRAVMPSSNCRSRSRASRKAVRDQGLPHVLVCTLNSRSGAIQAVLLLAVIQFADRPAALAVPSPSGAHRPGDDFGGPCGSRPLDKFRRAPGIGRWPSPIPSVPELGLKRPSKGRSGAPAERSEARGTKCFMRARCIVGGKFGVPVRRFAAQFSGRISAEEGVVDSPQRMVPKSEAPPPTSRYQIDLRIPQTPGLDFAGPDGTKDVRESD